MINHVQEAHQRVEIVKEKGSQIDHVLLHDTNQAETECHPGYTYFNDFDM